MTDGQASGHPEALGPLRPVVPFRRNERGHVKWDTNVAVPDSGSIILINVPFTINGPRSIRDQSTLSSFSQSQFDYHPCIVYETRKKQRELVLKLFICRSYSALGAGALNYVDTLPEKARRFFVPIHPSLPGDPLATSPDEFDGPLLLEPGFRFAKPFWAIAVMADITVPCGTRFRPFPPAARLKDGELDRLCEYSFHILPLLEQLDRPILSVQSGTNSPPLGGELRGVNDGRTGRGGSKGTGSGVTRGLASGSALAGGGGVKELETVCVDLGCVMAENSDEGEEYLVEHEDELFWALQKSVATMFPSSLSAEIVQEREEEMAKLLERQVLTWREGVM